MQLHAHKVFNDPHVPLQTHVTQTAAFYILINMLIRTCMSQMSSTLVPFLVLTSTKPTLLNAH